jgi:hypothetical protein
MVFGRSLASKLEELSRRLLPGYAAFPLERRADGRACDAIETAFRHDGPAIKKLGVIEGLKGLLEGDLQALRAFLYSL